MGRDLKNFLDRAGWGGADCAPLAGDASTRRYYRVRLGARTAVLMDASQNLETVAPFIRIAEHLNRLGLSAPDVLVQDQPHGLLLVEDFGDQAFARLLEDGRESERKLYLLAADVLIALHKHPQAIPPGLRSYHPRRMLADLELYLDWRAPGISEGGRAAFRSAWLEALPLAHRIPSSLLLRDYHLANLMWLPEREGARQAGLLDFQDAYQGPIAYDLVSLLEDARRDAPESLREEVLAYYLDHFPALDRNAFETSLAILAALRHARVLAIFERLSRRDAKPDYKRLHSPRVEERLRSALRHPTLAAVKKWFDKYDR